MEPTHPPYRGYGIAGDPEAYQAMIDKLWTDRGQIPPWWRVIVARKDITEQPVESWPPTFQKKYAEGWRPWLMLPDGSAPKYPTV